MKKLLAKITTLVVVFFSTIYSANAFFWNSGYTDTKYPIVLVHGLTGFDNIGGLINYFHTIPFNLERSGAKVYVPSVSAFNSSEKRGQQLADYLMQLPESKFNLIGHSQGAPTSRVAASLLPHRVASVTSVNGVNQGTVVADIVLGVLPDGLGRDVVTKVANGIGNLISAFSGTNGPQDSLAATLTLSTAGTQALNEALDWKGVSQNCSSLSEDVSISGNNIKMYSWSGNRTLTNVFDVSDLPLAATGLAFQGQGNDGLVDVCSARLGRVISTSYRLNHLDAVNHLFGARGWTNPVSLYRNHANRLKNSGL